MGTAETDENEDKVAAGDASAQQSSSASTTSIGTGNLRFIIPGEDAGNKKNSFNRCSVNFLKEKMDKCDRGADEDTASGTG